MIRTLYYPQAGGIRTQLTAEELTAALTDSEGLLWVDFDGEPPDTCEPILRNTFGFHPLAIDDALEETHIPKLDDWETYLYLVLRAVIYNPHGNDEINVPELDVFLGKNYLVTHHDNPIAAVDRVWDLYRQDARFLKRGSGYLLYKLIDELVDNYFPVVEALDNTIDLIEGDLFDTSSSAALERLFTLKRSLLHLRRIIFPQRAVLNKLTRNTYSVVKDEDRIFFSDVYDHLARLYEIIESMRELSSSALNTYLSVVNNRMNDVMKTLTLVATLFMPLSFIVGFFGMNFFQPVTPLPLWTSMPLFILTLLVIISLPLSMYLWMRQRGWL